MTLIARTVGKDALDVRRANLYGKDKNKGLRLNPKTLRIESVVIDENGCAADQDSFDLGALAISPDHATAAYTTDTDGGERYTLRFRTIAAGDDLADVVEDVTDGVAWADDSRSCFYIRPDAAMRPAEVWCHVLGTDASADRLVLREDDEHFFVSVQRTRSGRFVLIEISSKTTSEVWSIPTDDPAADPRPGPTGMP